MIRITCVGLLFLALSGCQTMLGPEPATLTTPQTHVITAITGDHGKISPQGDVSVVKGQEQGFSITPDKGYRINEIRIDGNPIGAIKTYTFRSVLTDHSISASFAQISKKRTKRTRRKTKKRKQVATPAPKPPPPPPVIAPVIAQAAPISQPEASLAIPPPAAPQAPIQPAPEPAPAPAPKATQSPQTFSKVSAASLAAKADPVEKGVAILREVENRDAGFGDYIADMIMILTNQQGDEVTRFISYRALEVAGDGDKSMTIFKRPADINGTALLTHSRKLSSDQQWLYLPALKRVKRISSSNQSGSFMGSEFAYEDLSSQEIEKYTYKWLRDEKLMDKDCFVIDAYPVSKRSGYTRQERWYDKAELIPLQINYYDRKRALLKTVQFLDYKQYLGQYWRSGEMVMINHQSGKATSLRWNKLKFRRGLSDRDFDSASLKRVR